MTDIFKYTNVSPRMSRMAFRFGKPPEEKLTMKKDVLKNMAVGETISTKCLSGSTPIHEAPSTCITQQRWNSAVTKLHTWSRKWERDVPLVEIDMVCYQNTTYIKRID